MERRNCRALNEAGAPCRQPPLRSGELCFWHEPECAEQAREARRLGGLRRRKEATLGEAYGLDGLSGSEDIRRLLEIAAFDGLQLDNSVQRVRALAYIARVASTNLQAQELEDRLQAIERILNPRR